MSPEFQHLQFICLNFIYLFLAVLGLRRCAQALSSCGEWGLLFVAVRGLLIAVASLVALAGGFLTTVPPGKPYKSFFCFESC